MRLLATALTLSAFSSCQPIGGADPLDNAGSSISVIHTVTDEERTESSFRGEVGMEASADF